MCWDSVLRWLLSTAVCGERYLYVRSKGDNVRFLFRNKLCHRRFIFFELNLLLTPFSAFNANWELRLQWNLSWKFSRMSGSNGKICRSMVPLQFAKTTSTIPLHQLTDNGEGFHDNNLRQVQTHNPLIFPYSMHGSLGHVFCLYANHDIYHNSFVNRQSPHDQGWIVRAGTGNVMLHAWKNKAEKPWWLPVGHSGCRPIRVCQIWESGGPSSSMGASHIKSSMEWMFLRESQSLQIF